MSDTTTIALSAIRLDGGTQSRAMLDEDAIANYAENVSELPPMVVFYDGDSYWLADGFHRAHAYERAGRCKVPVTIKQGTVRDALLFSVGANRTNGLRRTQADKRRAVELLLGDEEWAGRSDRWIAQTAGVGVDLVGDLKRKSGVGNDTSRRLGKDGKSYPATNGRRLKPSAELLPVVPVEPIVQFDRPPAPVTPPAAAPRSSFREETAALFTSERPDWCTPIEIIEAVRRVFSVIELDPCSNAQSDVHARTEWTEVDDGLSREWIGHGTVYVNPPYGAGIAPWIRKCVEAGFETDVIALVPARTDTKWFHRIIKSQAAIGFLKGRLTFKGAPHPAPFPSAIVHWGGRAEFVEVFTPLCTRIWTP